MLEMVVLNDFAYVIGESTPQADDFQDGVEIQGPSGFVVRVERLS